MPSRPEIISLDAADRMQMSAFEFDYVREAMVTIKQFLAELDAGYALKNTKTYSILFKNGRFYYEYLLDTMNNNIWIIKMRKADFMD